ncbi:protein translocase subunit SecF [Salinilacihabitans rarus]|uniref:protein translocase subunit SecF n=1 Tax=Salinilacihabitans rarus TaxID=2961596 RepID=UPI0020C8DA6D|nr:protein translocase subunit SecF [Salinilacihabitans rarus]
MGYFEVPEIDYSRYTNRQLAAVPLALLAVALLVLAGGWVVYGTPVQLGMDFSGGSELTVQTSTPEGDIPAAFDEEPESIQSIQTEDQYIVKFPAADDVDGEASGDGENRLTQLREQAASNLQPIEGSDEVVLSASSTSASFGLETLRTALLGLSAAFVGMSLLAFVLFRTFVPSIAIVVSAFSDVMIPLAFMNVVGIPLSLGTIAALLMLIGYSVDSDILLNNHILRRSGSFYESTYRAMQTGVTMTVTSMSAMFVMAISAWAFGIDLLASIGIILVVGLATDLLNTYMLNLSLLRWYKFEGVAR